MRDLGLIGGKQVAGFRKHDEARAGDVLFKNSGVGWRDKLIGFAVNDQR